MIKDCDWNKIFTDIENNEDSFSRYYPSVRVVADSVELMYLVKALILNDAHDYLPKIMAFPFSQ